MAICHNHNLQGVKSKAQVAWLASVGYMCVRMALLLARGLCTLVACQLGAGLFCSEHFAASRQSLLKLDLKLFQEQVVKLVAGLRLMQG
jgi:hypothetical protein